jgi:hypothetical protein
MTKNKEKFTSFFTTHVFNHHLDYRSKLQGRKIGYDTPRFAATATRENIAREGYLKAMEMNWDK